MSLVTRGSQADIVGLKVLFCPVIPSKSELLINTSIRKLGWSECIKLSLFDLHDDHRSPV